MSEEQLAFEKIKELLHIQIGKCSYGGEDNYYIDFMGENKEWQNMRISAEDFETIEKGIGKCYKPEARTRLYDFKTMSEVFNLK